MTRQLTPFGRPSGKNGDDTTDLFLSRTIYDKYVLENRKVSPVRSWGSQLLYGRIDFVGDAVFPKSNLLRAVNYNSSEEILLIEPVAQAATDLFQFFEKTKRKNFRVPGGLLENIKPVLGFVNIFERYDRYMRAIYGDFENITSRKIKNFEHFIRIFKNHLQDVSKDVTFSSFVLSKYAHPRMSGLVLEISKEDFSDDDKKSEYILDPNFDFYYAAALKFGFKIDKNAPWRLIADINSPVMKQYYTESENFSENVFESYFSKAFEEDIRLLKNYMVNFYLSYSFANKKCGREPDKNHFSNLLGQFSERFWVSFYIDLKEIENS